VATKHQSVKTSSNAGIGIAIVVVILVVVGGFFLFLNHPNNSGPTGYGAPTTAGVSNPLSAPATVVLSGAATASGQGTSITEVTFSGNQGTFSAPVSGGQYSVSLPNPGTYSVSEIWYGQYQWQNGTVQNVGSYTLNQGIGGETQLNYDLPALTTPNSQIQVSGALQTSFSTTPTFVDFVDPAGQGVELTSSNGNTYSGQVPNLMTYKVVIYYKNAIGGIQNCTAGTEPLNEPAGTSSMTANWHC
jgi:hypothetical protein